MRRHSFIRAALDDLPGLVCAVIAGATLVVGLHLAPQISRLLGGL